MTKISDLPVNLVEEILSKVPMKYMRAVRLTCKEWDTLSKSRSFSKMHIDKINAGHDDQSMMVAALMGYSLYLMKVFPVVDEDPLIEYEGKLNKEIRISQVFHCDGLLLCVLEDDYAKVIVWNPYWGQTRSIECRCSSPPDGRIRFSYALGYEEKGSSCRAYKFLRFIDQYVGDAVGDKFIWYEVYDFESSSWKTLDVTPHWFILSHQHGVSLMGNTYWLALPRNIDHEDALDRNRIICFDFTSESFGPLLRLPFDARDDDIVTLSCVRDEKLAVLFAHDDGLAIPLEFEIWITTKNETEEVSWSKFLSVVDALLIPYDFFFIDEEKKVAMGFELEVEEDSTTFSIVGEAGYLKKLELGKRLGTDRSTACSYVASLVNIKQPDAGCKRKQESELEKQRYDQNMARLVAIEKRTRVW
ncbi:F-box protein [Raphanus sativus]|uniref:F-box protein At2g38590-like n=1 Tax=Raphanus sativus TaxID=3726 RepID=A0A6J0NU40_RAPSA|nr:F-box protein At2g38590-like [Raphanus sativus]KAJ4898294.1 F-box protein [Raphanus sativus]